MAQIDLGSVQGPQGPKGDTGDKGDKGDKGDPATNTTYTLTQDASDGHKFALVGSDGSSKSITIPDNNTTYTLSSLGIGNVKNYDQSKAIKSITRSGTTFTYTCLDNTTGTFTQQDNNTWTAMTGATASADGAAGYVPKPPKDGYNTKYLRADGTWSVPPNDNTTYTSKAAASGGTEVSLVTTGEKATWNAKTSNTGTITKVQANGTDVASSGVANIPAATTAKYGVTQLSSATNSTSEALAATPKAVKDAYDLANSKTSNIGTVTKVSTGVGLTGGDITGTGTVKAKLKTETAHTLDSAAQTNTASRQYAVGVDKSGYLSVNVPWTNTTYTPATAAPLMDGTAAVGTSAKYAREDHRHPVDTSRASATDLTALSDYIKNHCLEF